MYYFHYRKFTLFKSFFSLDKQKLKIDDEAQRNRTAYDKRNHSNSEDDIC